MKFVKFSDNYADEFDVIGYALFENEYFLEWSRAVSRVTELTARGYNFNFEFGTNEYLSYDENYVLGECFEVYEVYEPELSAINKFIVNSNETVGVFPTLEAMNNFIKNVENGGIENEE